MLRGSSLVGCILFVSIFANAATPPAALSPPRPKLILALVIDQFRGDYLARFESRFLPPQGKGGEVGGFRWLMSQGAYFPQGQFDVLQCMTGPGHAMIATGAYPYQMGIPLNGWLDPATQTWTYAISDPGATIVGPPASTPEGAKKRARGASPRNLKGSTFGDELKNAGYPSRVISIALKDRASIMLGGHRADLALWFDSDAFGWVSSSFYGKTLPAWVDALNARVAQDRGKPMIWELPKDKATGFSEEGIITSFAKVGKGWPHHADGKEEDDVLIMPIGGDLTEEAAERAIEGLHLGRGAATDLLSVSFSGHDYLSHHFGPNSRELEERTLHEDRLISRLLNRVRKTVPGGLKDVVVVLTGDHGVAPFTELAKSWRLEAGQIDEGDLQKRLEARLADKFGKPGGDDKWVLKVFEFNTWLNRPKILERKLDLSAFEAEAKALLATVPGVAWVFTRTDYEKRQLPPGILERQILHGYLPGRNGDVMVIPEPYFTHKEWYEVSHVTGRAYDRTVPIILAGAALGIRPGRYATRADVIDIAPTLSYLSGVLPPSLSEGRVLSEILGPPAAVGPALK